MLASLVHVLRLMTRHHLGFDVDFDTGFDTSFASEPATLDANVCITCRHGH